MKDINIFYSRRAGLTDGLIFYCFELMCLLIDNNIPVKLVYHGDREELVNSLQKKYIVEDKYIKNISIYNFSIIKNMFIMSPIILNNIKDDVVDNPIKFRYLFESLKNVKYIVFAKNQEYMDDACKILKHDYKILSDNKIYNTKHINFFKKIYFKIYKKPKEEKNNVLFNGASYAKFDNAYKYLKKSKIKNYIFLSQLLKDDINVSIVPVDNLMEQFDTYYYCKDFFDEAPRFVQECFYFNKKIIYDRPEDFSDGGLIYYNRGLSGFDFNLNINDLKGILC